MVKWYEAAFDALYPVLYPHRDDAEAELAAESFKEAFDGHAPVLDVACGGGRHMKAFVEHGIEIYGVDLSEFLLKEAVSSRRLTGTVVRGDMKLLPFATGSFGGAINMFTSFGYFDTDVDNVMVFQEVARVLRDGGVFLFDFMNADHVKRESVGSSTRTTDGFGVTEDRRLEDGGRTIVKHVVAVDEDGRRQADYEERVRLYTVGELTVMLEGANMAVSGVFGDYDRSPFDPDASPRVIMVCEKEPRPSGGARP